MHRRELGDLLAAVAVIDGEQGRIVTVGQPQGDSMRVLLGNSYEVSQQTFRQHGSMCRQS